MVLVSVLLSFAAPEEGFALLLEKTETPILYEYVNPWGNDAVLAQLSAEVYRGGYDGAYTGLINFDLGPDDILYVYEIANVDYETPLSEITALSVGKTADPLIDLTRAGSLSGNARFSVYEPNILISGLSIQPSEMDVVYFVSNHLPNWFDSYLAGTWASPHAEILSPNCPPPTAPEP